MIKKLSRVKVILTVNKKYKEMISMIRLLREQDLKISIPDLYGMVNESIIVHLVENRMSEMSVVIFLDNKFFRLKKSYEGIDFGELIDRVSEDVLDHFANLQENLGCENDEITVDFVLVTVE